MGEVNKDGLDLANPWFSATDVELTLDGRHYTYCYLPGEYRRKRYGAEVQVKPPGVQLSVAVSGGFGGSVVIVPEDGWDRVCRRIGLCPEFQTDVPDVDAEFMLSGVIGEDLGRVFRSPATHQCLRELFNQGFTRIELFSDRATAICRPWVLSIPTEDPPDEFRKAVPALGQLQDLLASVPAMPQASSSRMHHRLSSPSPIVYAFAGAIAAVLLFVALQFASFLSVGDVVARLGGPALAAGAAAAVIMAGVMRREAFRGRTIVAVLFLAMTASGFATLDALTFANQALDVSVATRHDVGIRTKWRTYGRSPTYTIRTATWRADHTSETFDLSRSVWTAVTPWQNSFVVETHAGYFGVEWIEDTFVH